MAQHCLKIPVFRAGSWNLETTTYINEPMPSDVDMTPVPTAGATTTTATAATTPPSETVLAEAQRIVDGPRRAPYGHPLDSQTRIADMANVVLGPKLAAKLNWHDVNMFLFCLKLAREVNAPHRDNIVDICGYARVMELCQEEEGRRACP